MDQDILTIKLNYSKIILDKPQALADHEMKELINAIKTKRNLDSNRPASETKRKKKRKCKSPELCELEKIQKKLFEIPKDQKRKPVPRRLFTPTLDDNILISFKKCEQSTQKTKSTVIFARRK
ncbi:uncharacterized protein LOC116337907 [Contarinia nasturtii]|uniref:uncharacterized protein LOC116337907 n=1 Tax=Contarinia nasturtii TaxID=265458 RepID=UPI0012D425F6|nr:uncharacterized protein LOC116337907 [Contarinia nasturtii]